MKRYKQSATVVKISSKKEQKPELSIVVSKRTGYQNIWINGQHYYYNRYEQLQDIADADFTRLAESAESRNKRLIVIRRK